MSYADWDFYGPDDQLLIDHQGSMRCQLAGLKWMLYNGTPALVDSEIIADIRRYGVMGSSRGGLVLRFDVDLMNCYYLERDLVGGSDGYFLRKLVAGVRTLLWSGAMGHAAEDWARVRFRIDGWHLSVHEWINGDWQGKALVEDLTQAHASGYAGLLGANDDLNASVLFDNIEIAVKA